MPLRHGDAIKSGAGRTPEHRAWSAMRKRCKNPHDQRYGRYGGRGITVCDRWEVYENFLEDMGRRPTPDHSIDRVDNDGPYSPENCRWATRAEQYANRPNYRREQTSCRWDHRLVAPNLVACKLAVGVRNCLACNRAHGDRRTAHRRGVLFDFRSAADAHYARIMVGAE